MADATPALIPCFLCGNGLEVRQSKRNKPYFICDSCGVQTFVRRKEGMRLFERLIQSLDGERIRSGSTQESDFRILSLVNRMEVLRGKLRDIRNSRKLFDVLEPDKGMEAAQEALKAELARIECRLGKDLK